MFARLSISESASQSRPFQSRLRDLVGEASQALIGLDADRLEEMALSCRVLVDSAGTGLFPSDAIQNRTMPLPGSAEHLGLVREAREAAQEMAVFARVLEVTRDNLNVLRRLRALREGRLEYGAEARDGYH